MVGQTCPHSILAPRWDRIQDMGHEEKAVAYACQSCQASFSVEKRDCFVKHCGSA